LGACGSPNQSSRARTRTNPSEPSTKALVGGSSASKPCPAGLSWSDLHTGLVLCPSRRRVPAQGRKLVMNAPRRLRQMVDAKPDCPAVVSERKHLRRFSADRTALVDISKLAPQPFDAGIRWRAKWPLIPSALAKPHGLRLAPTSQVTLPEPFQGCQRDASADNDA
jgi:hypothetical protein